MLSGIWICIPGPNFKIRNPRLVGIISAFLLQSKYSDWKEFLVKRLTGARTLPTNFYKVVWESVSSVFKPGMKLEVRRVDFKGTVAGDFPTHIGGGTCHIGH